MRYTVLLTDKVDGNIHVTVPGIPDCTLEAPTRNEALYKIRETITTIINHSEIVQLDVPVKPKSKNLSVDTPWDLFGIFHDDPTWAELFDEIEMRNNNDQG